MTVINGRLRLSLIRDLAMNEPKCEQCGRGGDVFDPERLVEKYGLTPSEVEAFAQQYAEEIAEVKSALSGTLRH